LQLFFADYVK